jgi:MrcB-like, N-terminal domain/Protein NO VEIN, C-terminal
VRRELERVLELQSSWSWRNTVAMEERGRLIRRTVPARLRGEGDRLSAAIGIPLDDLIVEGRDGTGRKTRVPWVRFGSRARSPSATTDFYVVYLWAFDGSAAYLSLNQGTTDFQNGEFVRKRVDVLERRVAWAREVVEEWMSRRDDLSGLSLYDVGDSSLGRGYELGHVASVAYSAGAIPNDKRLSADAASFAAALGNLYREHARTPLPDEVPELVALEDAADEAAGMRHPSRPAGFRLSKEDRDAVEKRAMDVAEAYYAAENWVVRRAGAPFDLELTRGGEKRTVEVKGTTSLGQAVPLTYGERLHHAMAYPDNALVVVREIVLDRSTSPSTANGGVLYERHPWKIDEDALRVISYRYDVPAALYEEGEGIAADDLL